MLLLVLTVLGRQLIGNGSSKARAGKKVMLVAADTFRAGAVAWVRMGVVDDVPVKLVPESRSSQSVVFDGWSVQWQREWISS